MTRFIVLVFVQLLLIKVNAQNGQSNSHLWAEGYKKENPVDRGIGTANGHTLTERFTHHVSADMNGHALRYYEGNYPNFQQYFNIGKSTIDSTLSGLVYARVINNSATLIIIDTSRQYLGRTNFLSGGGAGLTIKNEANSSQAHPDITLETKKNGNSSRFGFSADTGTCEIYQYDPVLGKDVIFIGVDQNGRQANIYTRTGDNAIGTQLILDSVGVKLVHDNNMRQGYMLPTDTGSTGNLLFIEKTQGGDQQLNWTRGVTVTEKGDVKAANFYSDIYLPIVKGATNIDSALFQPAQYARTANYVSVSGSFNVDPTKSDLTQLHFSLPVVSNMTHTYRLAGTASNGNGNSAAISGETKDNTGVISFKANDTKASVWYYSFSYLVE